MYFIACSVLQSTWYSHKLKLLKNIKVTKTKINTKERFQKWGEIFKYQNQLPKQTKVNEIDLL